jgi:Co/Zn/Cd efflux system component
MSLDTLGVFLYQTFGTLFLYAAAVIMCLGGVLALLEAINRIFSKSKTERR